jgi:hypothetical protein
MLLNKTSDPLTNSIIVAASSVVLVCFISYSATELESAIIPSNIYASAPPHSGGSNTSSILAGNATDNKMTIQICDQTHPCNPGLPPKSPQ